MPQVSGNRIRFSRHTAFLSMVFLACVASYCAGCKKQAVEQPAQQSQDKRYHLVGTIVEVRSDQNTLIVDGQNVPGFMAAMTMPYPVHAHADLAGLNAGDEITADIVVGASGAYLDNIVVTKKAPPSAGGKPTTEMHQPQPGDKVPDFAVINQDGKTIHLSSFKGHPLLVTFIYTRCPFPDYCPLVSQDFAKIYAETKSNLALGSKLRLLTISFDTAYDTPKVLRAYAATFNTTTGGQPFGRWEFAVIPPKELKSMTDFFGFYYSENGGQIVHSMSTSVITPQGTIYKWYDDNDWQPADLIADATKALQEGAAGTAPASAAAAAPRT